MTDCGIVFMTAASLDEAEKIANYLVEERLAACSHIISGIQSVYRWEGKVHRETEVLLTAKTTRDAYPRLEAVVKSLHSYKVPQIVYVPIDKGSVEYIDWLRQMVE